MLKINQLYKSFNNIEVLKGITAEFKNGETSLIIGQSGSGKTVLLKCLLDLYNYDKGDIYYGNQELNELSENEKMKLKSKIGTVFQGSALFDSMNIEENVMLPLKMFTNYSNDEIADRANFVLKRVNLINVNKKMPSEASGGMQKRVAIARAIVNNPEYLFCDEPNSGLDPKTAIVIDNLIKEITLEFDITTVVISHDMNSVMEISDFISFIHQGQKWWEGSRDDILNSENVEVVNFVYASNFMKAVRDNFKKR